MKALIDFKFQFPEAFTPEQKEEFKRNITHSISHTMAVAGLSPDTSGNFIVGFDVQLAEEENDKST